MSEINTDWTGIRNSDAKAKIKDYRKVLDVLAIQVENASIREAEVTGLFELANTTQPFDVKDGELRVEVKCLWYERKPKTTWMHLTLSKNWALITNYSGEVANNISS